MPIFRNRRGVAIDKEQWISLWVGTDGSVATSYVVTPGLEEVEVLTRWVGFGEVDKVTGIESEGLFRTLVYGGGHSGTCVGHPTLIRAIRYHDAAVAALRADMPLPGDR